MFFFNFYVYNVFLYFINITSGCGGILRENSGIVKSHQQSGKYPSSTNCKWIIIAPPGHVIQLNWPSFHLESSINCVYDYVVVYENRTNVGEGSLIGKYCGLTLPPTIMSSSNMITMNFVADASVAFDGFIASYIFLNESTGKCERPWKVKFQYHSIFQCVEEITSLPQV